MIFAHHHGFDKERINPNPASGLHDVSTCVKFQLVVVFIDLYY